MATDSGHGPKSPDLLPPLPAWRQEVRARVEAYRHSHPRPDPTKPAGQHPDEANFSSALHPRPDEPGPPRVLPFRQQPALVVLTQYGSAEPIAEAIELPPPVSTPAPDLPAVAVAASSASPEPAGDYLQLPLPMGTSAVTISAPPLASLAPLPLRLQAGLTDALLVAVAALLFAAAGWASQSFPPFSAAQLRPLLPAVIAVPALLGALYLLLCAYAGGATVGMRMLGLAVTGWDGPLTAAARRRRGWASVVSLAALGMGFIWIFCDRQHLGWHDAISRTCVVCDAPADASR